MNDGGILNAREQRRAFICGLTKNHGVITIKANVPGPDKRIKEGALTVRHFVNLVLERCKGEVTLLDGADGLCAAVQTDCYSKQAAVELESTHEIGRLVDIDVFHRGCGASETRGTMRKCYLCGNAAFVCARLRNHSTEQLVSYFKDKVRHFFSDRLCKILKDSFMSELNLEDKFGLVTPTSRGSHKDLDYGLMQKAQDAVIPYLVQSFWYGLDNGTDGLLEKIRPLGIQAESAMLEECGGANAYKGLIFVTGIILAAAGSVLADGGSYKDINTAVKEICRGVEEEFDGGGNTFGKRAFELYGIKGVRGHAKNGFNATFEAEEMIDGEYSPDSLLKALCYIVGRIDDTVLLKRSGSLQSYQYFKRAISAVDIQNKQQLGTLNDECLKSNISIGGSADVLCASLLLKKLKSLWYF